MKGYGIVYLKAGSIYEDLGLKNGDIITAIDQVKLDKKLDTENFSRIKTKDFKTLQVDRCLKIKSF